MVNNRNTLILLVILVAIPTVIGFEHTIETIKNCEGTIKITDRTEYDGVYSIKDCDWKDSVWSCPCKPLPRPLILVYENKDVQEYNFVIEYYVGDNNDENNKRTYSYEGLKVSEKKENKPFVMPILEANTKTLLFVGLGLLGVIILIIVGIIIKRMYNKQDTEDTSDYPIQRNNEEPSETIEVDEDVANILDKYG